MSIPVVLFGILRLVLVGNAMVWSAGLDRRLALYGIVMLVDEFCNGPLHPKVTSDRRCERVLFLWVVEQIVESEKAVCHLVVRTTLSYRLLWFASPGQRTELRVL